MDPAEAAAANKMFASQGKKLEEELASAQAAAAQLASESAGLAKSANWQILLIFCKFFSGLVLGCIKTKCSE